MRNTDSIKSLLLSKLPDAHVDVSDMTGTDDHLEILVATDQFKGKLLFEQHKLVMEILKESLKEQVHAVKIKTMTMEKYNQL